MPEQNFGGLSGERELLTGYLDWYRAVVEHKVEGLSLSDGARQLTASGLSPLGVVKHLGWVEYNWFRYVVAGEDVAPPPRVDGDNAVQFRVDHSETAESILAFYRSEAEHARVVMDAVPSLDQVGVRESRLVGKVTVRWVLVHMIEETARHAGHLDLMREEIDGRTGYL
ncbi:MAG TPA: DinB family protein [Acidimicrobiales bacterium]|nr:DinB family protein [Acidimicrobiales bacterium]